jgi:hypothetical protein
MQSTVSFLSEQEQQPSPYQVVTSRQARAIVRRSRIVWAMTHVLGMVRIPKGEVLKKLAERGRQRIQVSIFEDTVCLICMNGLMPHLEKSA